MMFYPVTDGKVINVLAVKYTPGHGKVYDGPWVEPTTGDAVAKLFEGWEPNALALIKVRPTLQALRNTTDGRTLTAILNTLPIGGDGTILLGNAQRTQLAYIHQGTNRSRRGRRTLFSPPRGLSWPETND